MQGILTFASLGLGLALTLLFGPQWGIVMGLLAYLAGSNVLLNRDVNKLKAHIDRIINELPELLRELTIKAEPPAAAPAPVQEAVTIQPEPADAIEQRMQALDHKLELLLRHVQSPAPQASTPSPADSPPAQPAAPSPPTAIDPVPQAGPLASTPSARDLDLMRELLLKLAETMAAREGTGGAEARHDPTPQAPPPSPLMPAKEDEATGRRLSIDELRSELDKIAQELSIELGRPKP
ncbi:MAG: hypothetical protein ACOZAP_00065 [Pseudomonadota bacterium]